MTEESPMPRRWQLEVAKRLLEPLGLKCLDKAIQPAWGELGHPGAPVARELCTSLEEYGMLVMVGRKHIAEALIRAVLVVTSLPPDDLPLRVISPPEPIVSDWSAFLTCCKDRACVGFDASLKPHELRRATAEWLKPGFEIAVASALLGGCDSAKLRFPAMRLSLSLSAAVLV